MAPTATGREFSLEERVACAQGGDERATEALLEQFRPLLRSRMHALWTSLREGLFPLEWADVESQVTLLFLSRLQAYEPQRGVFFPHYIEKMLDLDGRAWLKTQHRQAATPFSQLAPLPGEESSDPIEWLLPAEDTSHAVDRAISLRDALQKLPEKHKHIVWQCCILGRTEENVARELGVSRGAVRNRLEGALTQMRVELGVSTTVGASGQDFWKVISMAKDEKRPDLVGVGAGRPVLLQGTFDFPATGLKTPELLSPKLRYLVPVGCVAGIRFCRLGVICDKMVCLSTVVNGLPHRLIPVAANSTEHVAFAIVEPIPAGSEIEIHIASDAPGTCIVDVGCLQMPA